MWFVNKIGMPKTAITASNIYKSYEDNLAVSGVGFTVPGATCFGFLGPNGAGKSTLMKIIYGRTRRDAYPKGNLSVLGWDPQQNELAIKYRAGVVSQDNNLDQELNVVQNLEIYSRFYDIAPDEAGKRIDELLDFMELTEKRNAPIRSLSGGMMRRLVMVRALLNRPQLLILDEPTTGLDPQVRHVIWDKLRKLKKDGITILLTTHYMEEAYQICDHVFIMDKGKKVMEGKPQELINQNIEPYVLEIIHPELVDSLFEIVDSTSIRKDRSAGVGRLYADSIKELETVLNHLNPGDFYLRQSNLEDLFFKATGRNLNEKQ